MTTTGEPGTVEPLRAWARGSLPLSAAVELLVHAFDGRFAAASQPWIRVEPTGAVWLDDQFLAAGLGALSGGERRVLTVVAALADSTGTRRIDLTDVVTGLDRDNLDLVLAALDHASGSHEHAGLELADDRHSARLVRLPSLHPWPDVPTTNSTSDGLASRGSTAAATRRYLGR